MIDVLQMMKGHVLLSMERHNLHGSGKARTKHKNLSKTQKDISRRFVPSQTRPSILAKGTVTTWHVVDSIGMMVDKVSVRGRAFRSIAQHSQQRKELSLTVQEIETPSTSSSTSSQVLPTVVGVFISLLRN